MRPVGVRLLFEIQHLPAPPPARPLTRSSTHAYGGSSHVHDDEDGRQERPWSARSVSRQRVPTHSACVVHIITHPSDGRWSAQEIRLFCLLTAGDLSTELTFRSDETADRPSFCADAWRSALNWLLMLPRCMSPNTTSQAKLGAAWLETSQDDCAAYETKHHLTSVAGGASTGELMASSRHQACHRLYNEGASPCRNLINRYSPNRTITPASFLHDSPHH